MHPKEITLSDSGEILLILWSNDSRSTIPGVQLRKICSCSECRSRQRGNALSLSMLSSAAGQIREVDLISSSKLFVIWKDGHNKSIYTFTFLRESFPPEA